MQRVRTALRCDIAAGEYAADLYDVRALLPVVDCLQLDVIRCGGYTGWLRGAALAQSQNLDVSAHCAPSLHAFVDGAPEVRGGALYPDTTAPGHGMTVRPEARKWCTS
ncbi:enolase C-terminal domain-like protein [Mycolicibacterium sp. P9-64]|uniref:enolase C-terminal domain-like protein n=1 Tax=Mycolicibacterium sp. P9-64 TaxID=2024612 RepID=UPI0018D95C02|nr:enolase C-terminal domain-like protein [Mycolicibacterium sp. P9-64]